MIRTQSLKSFKRKFTQPDPLPRVISNSGGRTSALMTIREAEKGLGPNDYIIFTNTGLECEETLEFLHMQETVLGLPIIWLEYCCYNRWKRVTFETASRYGEPFTAIIADRRHWKWRPTLTETVLYASEHAPDLDSPEPAQGMPLLQKMVPVVHGSAEWKLYYHPEKFWGTVDNLGVAGPDGNAHELPVTLWQGGRPTFQEMKVERPNPNPFGLYLPNQQTRFCTQELKIRVMRDFMRSQGYGQWVNVVGIRADEPNRHYSGKDGMVVSDDDGVVSTKPREQKPSRDSRFDVEHPLFHAGTRKPDVLAYWKTQPFDLQLEDHEGNCYKCFLKGKAKLIKIMSRPEPKNARAEQWWHDAEAAAGVTFSKRQSYDELAQFAKLHAGQQTLDFWPAEESLSCACTD